MLLINHLLVPIYHLNNSLLGCADNWEGGRDHCAPCQAPDHAALVGYHLPLGPLLVGIWSQLGGMGHCTPCHVLDQSPVGPHLSPDHLLAGGWRRLGGRDHCTPCQAPDQAALAGYHLSPEPLLAGMWRQLGEMGHCAPCPLPDHPSASSQLYLLSCTPVSYLPALQLYAGEVNTLKA